MNEMIMVCHSVNDNTHMDLVILLFEYSLCLV